MAKRKSKRVKAKRITRADRVRASHKYGLVFDRFHIERPPRKKSS